MELIEEIEPILWAYIADVPEDHILEGRYEPGEEERVDEAIRILGEEGHIYLEYVPDFDGSELENIIEKHVLQHGVKHVFFDYIHITTNLIGEFQSASGGKMAIREDQVLSALSNKLKNITRDYNVSLDTWTQVSGDWKNEQNRDQTVVRGSRAIIDKADLAAIVSEPTEKEYKLLEKILKSKTMFGKPLPNRCISLYKNRGGKYNNIKIWLYVDYGTMRARDLFVTDKSYKILKIPKTFTGIIEDEKIVMASTQEELKQIMKAREDAIVIKDDGTSILEDLNHDIENYNYDIEALSEETSFDDEVIQKTKEIKEEKKNIKNPKLQPVEDEIPDEVIVKDEDDDLDDEETDYSESFYEGLKSLRDAEIEEEYYDGFKIEEEKNEDEVLKELEDEELEETELEENDSEKDDSEKDDSENCESEDLEQNPIQEININLILEPVIEDS